MLELDRKHWREESEGVYVRRRPQVPATVLLALCAVLGMDLTVAYAGFQQAQMASAAVMPAALPVNDRIPGLGASQSLITGVIDPKSLTASYYWTFVVHNDSQRAQEAQIQLRLPEAATVSRATLWVNGQAEEAAFNENSRVQGAYNWITRQHRDPLLVTQTAPGTISIKAAPVLPNQDMEFRLGITAAGDLVDGKAQYRLPYITKSNLDISCRQDVHLTSDRQFANSNPALNAVEEAHDQFLLRGNMPVDQLRNLVVCAGSGIKFHEFAVRATHSLPGTYIVANVAGFGADSAKLVLSKTRQLPNNRGFIRSDAMAYRLSSLWAFGEIERTALRDRLLAGQLATTYRVVSCVSGATVLEYQSDYDRYSLTRDPYQVLTYEPNSGFIRPVANPYFYYPREASTPLPVRKFRMNNNFRQPGFITVWSPLTIFFAHGALQAPLSQSFSTVVGQLNALNSYSAGSYSAGSYAGTSSAASPFSAGLVTPPGSSFNADFPQFTTLLATGVFQTPVAPSEALEEADQRENSFGQAMVQLGVKSGFLGSLITHELLAGGERNGSLFLSMFGTMDNTILSVLAINAVLFLLVANFAGPVWMLVRGYQSLAMQEQETSGWILGGLIWLALAFTLPDGSQLFLLFMLLQSTAQANKQLAPEVSAA